MGIKTKFLTALFLALTVVTVNAQEISATYIIPSDTPIHIREAVESNARTDEQRARDVGRKPAEVLTLAELNEGDNVIELASIGVYYTDILVETVGDGHVYMMDMPWTDRIGGDVAREFDDAHDNATYIQAHYNEVQFPEDVDLVTNVLFYHELIREIPSGNVDRPGLNEKIYAALKPGGIYLVIDHNAEAGSGWRDAQTTHRIDSDVLREEITAAGFSLELDSDLLANPEDNHTQRIFQPGMRGNTDRSVLVFRKPM